MPITSCRWTRPASSLALALFALTACTSPDPVPVPSSTVEPVFANEEEALAAVTATYEEYLALTNQIVRDQGADPERIATVTSADVASEEYEAFERIRTSGLTWSGDAQLVSTALQTWSSQPDPNGIVATGNVCVDVSATEVVDSTGTSVVPTERQTLLPFAIGISPDSSSTTAFILATKDLIEESTSCVR